MVICDFHLFDPVLVEVVTEMNPLLVFVGSLLADSGGIHQEHIFYSCKERVRWSKKAGQHPMENFMQKWDSFQKTFSPSSVRNI